MRRVILTIMLLFLLSVTAFAAKEGELEMEEITGSHEKDLYETISITPLLKEIGKRTITTFDVYDDGSYVLGYEGDNSLKYVSVYNADSEYISGFCFEWTGSFLVEFFEDYINLYMIRSDICVSVTPEGEILSFKKILNTQDNTDYKSELEETERIVGGKTYKIKKRTMLILPWYSQLVCIDENGNEEIIYEATTSDDQQMLSVLSPIIMCTVMTISMFGYLIRWAKKRKKQERAPRFPEGQVTAVFSNNQWTTIIPDNQVEQTGNDSTIDN